MKCTLVYVTEDRYLPGGCIFRIPDIDQYKQLSVFFFMAVSTTKDITSFCTALGLKLHPNIWAKENVISICYECTGLYTLQKTTNSQRQRISAYSFSQIN